MTYYEMHTRIRRKLPAILAGIALFIASAFSIGWINMFGLRFEFGFLPLIVIAMWPRNAVSLLSLAVVFAAGLFTDWATGGILGRWALVYSVIWGVMRPELRESPYAPARLLLMWFATCGLAVILMSVTGWFVKGILPDFAYFGRQIIFATLVFPGMLLLRHSIAKRVRERDDWGG